MSQSEDDLIDWALLQDYKKLSGINVPPPLRIDDGLGIEPLFGASYTRGLYQYEYDSEQVFKDLLHYWADKIGTKCPECDEHPLAVDDYLCPLCRANLDA
jgi:hypothetical protein